MFNSQKLTKFKGQISSASSVLVLLPPKPNPDLLTAGLALYSSLKKSDKNILIGCSSSIDSSLPDAQEIKQHIGNRNLIISFPYQPDSVDHVSYDIDQDKQIFNLRIKPSDQGQPLDSKKVEYSYTGAQADLVITLGIKSLEELGRLYSQEKDFLDSSQIVNIHYFKQSTNFPTLDLRAQATSLSEAVSYLIKKHKLHLPKALATPLYQRLLDNTNHFKSPQITPQTFLTAAFLLENEAQPASPPSSQEPPFFDSPRPHPPTPSPRQSTRSSTQPPIGQEGPSIPSDWQEPKIYRSDSKT